MSAAEKLARPIPPTPRVVAFNRVAEEDYFALDLAAESRLEYYDGEVIAMAGASPNHSDIALNVGAFLRGKLKNTCRARMSDQRVHVPARRGYVYPDVVVGNASNQNGLCWVCGRGVERTTVLGRSRFSDRKSCLARHSMLDFRSTRQTVSARRG